MKARLESDRPMHVSDGELVQWYVYTDAAYASDTKAGGLGAVLVDDQAKVVEWFGIALSSDECELFGASSKETIIYELELVETVLAFAYWRQRLRQNLTVWLATTTVFVLHSFELVERDHGPERQYNIT